MSTSLQSASRPADHVVLIGTIHMDRDSFQALRDLLVGLSPEVIGTEMSDFGVRFRRGEGLRIRTVIRRYLRGVGLPWYAASDLGATMALLSFPFEYVAASRAAHRLGARLCNLGRTRDSKAWLLPLARERWDDDRMGSLSRTGRDLLGEVAAAARCAKGCEQPRIAPGPRDRIYARRIEALAATGSRVAAVLGWEHVVPGLSGNTAWILHSRVCEVFLVARGETHLLG